MVCLRTHRDRARPDLFGQSADRWLSAVGLCGAGGPNGRGLASVRRRGHSHQHVFGPPSGLRMGPGPDGELERRSLVKASGELGEYLLNGLRSEISSPALQLSIRGVGLLAGVELRLPSGLPATRRALEAIQIMLERRFILLPEGEHSNVLTLTPPLTISQNQLQTAVEALSEVLNHG